MPSYLDTLWGNDMIPRPVFTEEMDAYLEKEKFTAYHHETIGDSFYSRQVFTPSLLHTITMDVYDDTLELTVRLRESHIPVNQDLVTFASRDFEQFKAAYERMIQFVSTY